VVRTAETLQAEHNGVLTVLDQLERAVAAAEQGMPLPPDVFSDIREFFVVFVDQCHHTKEETVLFPALGERGAGLASRLEDEHGAGRALAARYADAVDAYAASPASAADLAAAARAYAAFLRRHIDLETIELLPLVGSLPTDQDAAVAEAFDRIEEEELGPGTHERLHAMIDTLAPRVDAAIATAG
jgi:hemerythrin-like domain-containing protein